MLGYNIYEYKPYLSTILYVYIYIYILYIEYII